MQLIENLEWRYATKKYDSSKKVSDEDITKIKEAIQLSASSYGFQLYKILDVQDAEIRAKLQPASWGQKQVVDASHFFVFCANADVTNEDIDGYIQLKADIQGLNVKDLKGYGDFVKGKMADLTVEQKQVWTAKQVYIALSTALAACAELKIDSTPMEGFEPAKFDEILGLKAKGLKSVVLLAIGYRSEGDATQHGKKVRKSLDDLFETT